MRDAPAIAPLPDGVDRVLFGAAPRFIATWAMSRSPQRIGGGAPFVAEYESKVPKYSVLICRSEPALKCGDFKPHNVGPTVRQPYSENE